MGTLTSKLGFIDLSIVFGFFVLYFLIVYLSNRKPTKDTESFLDYILMGRRLTLPIFVATLVATWYGGIVGVTAIAYEQGIYSYVTQGAFWYLTYLLFAYFIVEKVYSSGAITLPELVKNQYGSFAGGIAAVFNFFDVVPIVYSISLGSLLSFLFGISNVYGIIIGTLVVCLYSLFGGFRTVVFTDVLQFLVMIFAIVLVVVVSYFQLGGLDYLQGNLPKHYFSLSGKESFGTMLVWGFIAMGTLIDPNFYQRCFAAKSAAVAKKGIIYSTIIWCVFDLCMVLGSMYAAAHMPGLDPNKAYLTYGMSILPVGLKGLFVAGFMATIISTLDSYIFVASNTISYDGLSKLIPRLNNATTLKFCNQISIIMVGCLSICLAFVFDGSIKDVWKLLGSYSAGCLLIPVMLGMFYKNLVSNHSFVVSVIVSVLGISYWRLVTHEGFWANVDDLYIGMFCSLLVIFLMKLINFNQPQNPKT